MKIFGTKKKRKSTDAPKATPQRQEFKSDPIVEELLKKDASQWNSKERRMIKRYQDRRKEESKEDETPAESGAEVETQEGGDDSNGGGNDNGDNSNSGSNDDGDNTNDAENVTNTEQTNDAATNKTDEQADAPAPVATDDGKVPKDHEVWDIIGKLTSKMKRTLSRKLDRLGVEVLEEVLATAKAAMEPSAAVKRPCDDTTTAPKKKKAKKGDWSALPPQERLRREEQRRMQKEAAARRERGEGTKGYKHPLNSERRRANRRKPKYGNRNRDGGSKENNDTSKNDAGDGENGFTEYQRDHHSSGFLHRKQVKQHQ